MNVNNKKGKLNSYSSWYVNMKMKYKQTERAYNSIEYNQQKVIS